MEFGNEVAAAGSAEGNEKMRVEDTAAGTAAATYLISQPSGMRA